MHKEFNLEVEWVNYELHPETPLEGVDMAVRFKGLDVEGMLSRLNRMGEPFGARFGTLTTLANSGPAIKAAEAARDQGRLEEFSCEIFSSYFTKGLNIGQREVLLDAARAAGLDPADIGEALDNGRYDARLARVRDETAALEIAAAPTFIIEGGLDRIVGAQPLDRFRQALGKGPRKL